MAVKKAQMMPTFVYEGIDRKGAKLKGEIPARNMALAKVTLRKQGITIKTIRQKKKNILRINELLNVFDLELFKDKKIQKLSGGQQQRVALARTLAQEAGIILLDEPFSAVDKEMRKKMQTEILKYQQEKEAIVFFISHQQDENSNFIANHKIFINFI